MPDEFRQQPNNLSYKDKDRQQAEYTTSITHFCRDLIRLGVFHEQHRHKR